jgi:hypothetical protein
MFLVILSSSKLPKDQTLAYESKRQSILLVVSCLLRHHNSSLIHQLHVFGNFDGRRLREGGGSRERRRREFFLSKPRERERTRKYEDFGPKITYIPLCVKVPECPLS